MEVEVVTHCDADLGDNKRALFTGQRYELPDEVAAALIASGHVRMFGGARGVITPDSSAPSDVRLVSRPRAKRK